MDADDCSDEDGSAAIISFETFRKKNGTELTPKQAQQVAEIVPKNMILFKFDSYIFTAGQAICLIQHFKCRPDLRSEYCSLNEL